MLEYKGKYGKAKVMIDDIDSTTVSQIYDFLNHEAFTNPISIMPDCHAGAGAVIGFTMRMTDKIIPNVVGVDINCGMLSINVGKNVLSQMTRNDIDSAIRERVPFGTNVRKDFEIKSNFYDSVTEIYRQFVMKFNKEYGTSYPLITFDDRWFQDKCEEIEMDYRRAVNSVGTLGGGK